MPLQNAVNNNDQSVDAQLIKISKEYTGLLQAGRDEQAESAFIEMCRLNQAKNTVQDNYLYREVGKITRELHDSINQFVSDSRMQMVAGEEMPDARQRLSHVVELTERSAHKTMSLIEHSLPLISAMNEKVSLFRDELDTGSTVEANAAEGNKNISDLLDYVSTISKEVSNDLSGIMLAQDYQDLTGQIIQRVSTLVQNVENELIRLLKITEDSENVNGTGICVHENDTVEAVKDNKGYGPAVPGIEKTNVLQSQDEVDDLLSSLGF